MRLIDADKLLEELQKKYDHYYIDSFQGFDIPYGIDMCIDIVKEFPTAKNYGYWKLSIHKTKVEYNVCAECSECGNYLGSIYSTPSPPTIGGKVLTDEELLAIARKHIREKYCPRCGIAMNTESYKGENR